MKFWDLLPVGYFLVGDNAYVLQDELIVPSFGNQLVGTARDVFNFYRSQLRIKIEQVFGFVVMKWRILKAPLEGGLAKHGFTIQCCMVLHNYVILERFRKNGTLDNLST